MQRWRKVAGIGLLLVVVTAFMPTARAHQDAEHVGFSIRNGRLVDAYGNDFVMRGVNHPHSWFQGELASLSDIKATGANTVRVVLSTGARFARTEPGVVATIVDRCERARLVCVLEVHDTTGYPQVDDTIQLAEAVEYWLQMLPVLQGHEDRVIVNLGNEPYGNTDVDDWAHATARAIVSMREAGYRHTLMVDAPNWGQDWSFTMRDHARSVFDTDPDRNVIFDVHMYGVYDTAQAVRSYIESFVRNQLPLVIGEFGATHTDGDPAEGAIFHWASMYGIGYLAWSWSGNYAPVADLNIVEDFDARRRTEWGDRVIDGPAGIAATSIEASIFGEPISRPRPLLAVVPPSEPLSEPRPSYRPVGRYEAETATRNGLEVAIHGAGYSGQGYLNGFDTVGDSVTITVYADRSGSYDLVFGYRSPFGDKPQRLTVNQQQLDPLVFALSPQFATVRRADVRLAQGANRVVIAHDWGWFDLDYVEVWAPLGD